MLPFILTRIVTSVAASLVVKTLFDD